MADLLAQTSSGPVLGFADTYPLRDSSAAPLIEAGEDGGLPVVQKWLVSAQLGISCRRTQNSMNSDPNNVYRNSKTELTALYCRASPTLKVGAGSVPSLRSGRSRGKRTSLGEALLAQRSSSGDRWRRSLRSVQATKETLQPTDPCSRNLRPVPRRCEPRFAEPPDRFADPSLTATVTRRESSNAPSSPRARTRSTSTSSRPRGRKKATRCRFS